jgi:hypothetical protein
MPGIQLPTCLSAVMFVRCRASPRAKCPDSLALHAAQLRSTTRYSVARPRTRKCLVVRDRARKGRYLDIRRGRCCIPKDGPVSRFWALAIPGLIQSMKTTLVAGGKTLPSFVRSSSALALIHHDISLEKCSGAYCSCVQNSRGRRPGQ